MRITFGVSTGYLSEKDETLATVTIEASLKANNNNKNSNNAKGENARAFLVTRPPQFFGSVLMSAFQEFTAIPCKSVFRRGADNRLNSVHIFFYNDSVSLFFNNSQTSRDARLQRICKTWSNNISCYRLIQ